jgi:hypothetical protein
MTTQEMFPQGQRLTTAARQADAEGRKRLRIAPFSNFFWSHEGKLQFSPSRFNSDCHRKKNIRERHLHADG